MHISSFSFYPSINLFLPILRLEEGGGKCAALKSRIKIKEKERKSEFLMKNEVATCVSLTDDDDDDDDDDC